MNQQQSPNPAELYEEYFINPDMLAVAAWAIETEPVRTTSASRVAVAGLVEASLTMCSTTNGATHFISYTTSLS